MCSVADCEREWIFGVSGVCNDTLGKCLCAEGFSGRDDWGVYESCNVSTELSRIFHAIALGASCLDAVVIFVSFLWYSYREGFTPEPQLILNRKNSKDTTGDQTPPSPRLNILKPPKPASTVPLHSHEAHRRAWNRKRGSLLSLFLFLAFSVLSVFYYIPFLISTDEYPDGFRRFNLLDEQPHPWVYIQSFTMSLAAGLLVGGFYASLVAWYNTLPSVTIYGMQLKMNRVLVRYPNLVYYASNTVCVVTLVGCLVFGFLFPIISAELKIIGDFAMLSLILAGILIYLVLLNVVVSSVQQIMRQYLKSVGTIEGGTEEVAMKKDTFLAFRNSVRNASLLIYGSNVACLIALVVFIITLTSEGQRHLFLSFNLLVILAHVASTVLVTMSAFCTSGGGAPIRRTRSRSRGSKTPTQGSPGNGFLPREIETEGSGLVISVSERLETRDVQTKETSIQRTGPTL